MIEDQVAPKRCGHTKGKQVVGRAEARSRIRAAVDAREAGPDILIMARTDARAVHGFEDALERCHEFVEDGADIIFLEAPDVGGRRCAASAPEIERPAMANMIDGGQTPILPADQLGEVGYRLAAYPLVLLSAAIAAMQQALAALRPAAIGDAPVARRTDLRATPGRRRLPGLLGCRGAVPHRLTLPPSAHRERSTMERVGFVGMGTMGVAMASNIARAGFPLTVWNRTPGKSGRGPRARRHRSEDPEGARPERRRHRHLRRATHPTWSRPSSGPTASRPVSAPAPSWSTTRPSPRRRPVASPSASREQDVGFVDAPVSGGSEGAQKGTLTIFVGGTAEDFERAQPVLGAMGKTITHMGPVGAGQAAKAVNQVILAGAYLGVAEGIVLGIKSGLDPEQLVQALSGGAARSWVLENRSGRMIANDYPLGFKTSLHLKDLNIALQLAARSWRRVADRCHRQPDRDRPRRPGPRERGHVQRGAHDPRPVRPRVLTRRGEARPAVAPTRYLFAPNSSSGSPSRPSYRGRNRSPLYIFSTSTRRGPSARSGSVVSAYLPSRISHHATEDAVCDQVHRDVRECDRDHRIKGIRLARCAGRRSARSPRSRLRSTA